MTNITPQTKAIYSLLARGNTLTAREIARSLHILPNTVYRAIKILNQFSFVQRVGNYPVKYTH